MYRGSKHLLSFRSSYPKRSGKCWESLGSFLNIRLEGGRIILEPAPPEVFVKLGEESEKILQEARRIDEESIKRLLRDLGVEGCN